MPKQRSPDSYKAEELYKKGKKLVEIASQLNVPEGTVRRWKSTYEWDTERSDKNSERSHQNKRKKKEAVVEDVKQVMENPDLTDKQRLFCIYYVKCFNATKAYQKAYGVDYKTAASIAYRMLENDGVKKEIQMLKKNRLNREMLDESDIFQKYMDIAFSDITDFVEFGVEEVPVMAMYGPVQIKDEKSGKKKILTQKENVIRFKDSNMVDGTLISEVKQGRNGTSIKLADRMKALDWLSDHMNLATEEQKARIEALKAKTKGGEQATAEDKVKKLFEAIGGALDAESE